MAVAVAQLTATGLRSRVDHSLVTGSALLARQSGVTERTRTRLDDGSARLTSLSRYCRVERQVLQTCVDHGVVVRGADDESFDVSERRQQRLTRRVANTHQREHRL